MSYPFAVQEARLRYPGATFTSEFTALNDATWVAAGGSPATIKIRPAKGAIDVSGLSTPRLQDPSARTRARGMGLGIVGKQTGTVQVPLFLNSTKADSSILTPLTYIFGALSSPTAAAATLDNTGAHTTSKLYSSGIEAKIAVGQAVLCGVRGDGRGNGEVIPVVAIGTNYVSLARTTKTAMQDGDVVWLSYTIYPDIDAAKSYFEMCLIGADATDVDQYNLIGCGVTDVKLEQINIDGGEMPIINLTVQPGRWRLEPSATKATISHTASTMPNPVALGVGGFWICDVYSTAQTRGYLLGGQMEVNPGIVNVPLQDPQHYNNIGGWRLSPGFATWKFTAYGGEGSPALPVPGFNADFDSGQDHQVMMQFGHAADACVAVAIDRSYLDRAPYRTELNTMLAYTFEGHAEERATTTDLIAADIKLHFFHTA